MNVTFIFNQLQLNDCVQHLSSQKRIALDLEFDNNRYRHGFTLCLIQVASEEEIFVIDPFNRLDLTEFYRLLERKDQRLVVFEFGEDLRLLNLKECRPSNIYDVSYASKLLDFSQLSLGNLVQKCLDIEMEKAAQKSNWVQRPLSQIQIDYAADDVRYLFQVQDHLENLVKEKGLEAWVSEENQDFENSFFEGEDPGHYLKHKDKKGLSQHHWYVFTELMHFRESYARQMNRPGYQIIDKDFLLELAQEPSYIEHFYSKSRPHKSLATEPFKQRVLRVRNDAAFDAKQKDLSKTELAIDRLSDEELTELRNNKAKEETIKEQLWRPIQAELKTKFGENTASFLLSNKTMADLAKGDIRGVNGYRLSLFKEIAENLKLDYPF